MPMRIDHPIRQALHCLELQALDLLAFQLESPNSTKNKTKKVQIKPNKNT